MNPDEQRSLAFSLARSPGADMITRRPITRSAVAGSRFRNSRGHGCAVAVLFAMAILLGQAAAAQDLSVTLSLNQEEYRQADTVVLTYKLTNNSSQTVNVLTWNTPLEGMIGDPFIVTLEGTTQERAYLGTLALRNPPVAQNWKAIPAGQSVSATVQLSQEYDLTAAGTYEIRLRRGLFHVARGASPPTKLKRLIAVDTPANTLRLKMLDAGAPSTPRVKAPSPGKAGVVVPPTFNACSVDQQSDLNSAFTSMAAGSSKVATAISNWSCTDYDNSNAAKTFFGAACSPQLLAQMKYVTSTASGYANGSIATQFDCSQANSCAAQPSACSTNGVIAFTCLGQQFPIYICSPFWGYAKPPAKDINAQDGLLYHETTHWTGTRDYAYWCPDCLALATNNPTQAQNNADSYRLFGLSIYDSIDNICGVKHLIYLPFVVFAIFFVRRISRRRGAERGAE